jgi:hypothetical protein
MPHSIFFTTFFKEALGAILKHKRQLASLAPKVPAKPHPRDVQLLQSVDKARGALAELATDEAHQAVPEIVPAPRLILRLAPFAAASARRLDPDLASQAIPRLALDIERYSDGVDERQWWVSGQPTMRSGPNPEVDWLSRLVRPGYFEHRATMGWRESEDEVVLVSGRELEGRIVRGLEMLVKGAQLLGLQGEALASITLEGLVGVELTRLRGLASFWVTYPL